MSCDPNMNVDKVIKLSGARSKGNKEECGRTGRSQTQQECHTLLSGVDAAWA